MKYKKIQQLTLFAQSNLQIIKDPIQILQLYYIAQIKIQLTLHFIIKVKNQIFKPQSALNSSNFLRQKKMQREPIINQKDSDDSDHKMREESSKQLNFYPRPRLNQALKIKFNACFRTGYFKQFQSLSIYYAVYHGKNWKKLTGEESGISQIGTSPNNKIVWNFPVQIQYETDYLVDPPQLIVIFYGNDFFGRSIARAYGNIRFPIHQGTQRRKLRAFKMSQKSVWWQLYGFFTGSRYQFKEVQQILGAGQNRQFLRTQSSGEVQVQFITKRYNFQKYGYEK